MDDKDTESEVHPLTSEIAHALMGLWMTQNNVESYDGHNCLGKLLNPRHHCASNKCYDLQNSTDRFRVLDHAEWWRVRDTKRFILTAHPYGLRELGDLVAYCQEHELGLEVDEHGSWYYPNTTNLIVMRGRAKVIGEGSKKPRGR